MKQPVEGRVFGDNVNDGVRGERDNLVIEEDHVEDSNAGASVKKTKSATPRRRSSGASTQA
jgi:hypothetical protein